MKWLDLPELAAGPGAIELRALAAGRFTQGNWPFGVPILTRPLYKTLSVADLQALRGCIYRGKRITEAGPWFEAIMRSCEVNMWRLERFMSEVWGRDAAPTLTVVTAACLLEVGMVSDDLRFLNTVLKLRASRLLPPLKRNDAKIGSSLALAMAVHELSNWQVEKCRKI